MGGNGRGGGGISTVDASITWDETVPTTDPPASSNGYSGRAVSPVSDNGQIGRPCIWEIGCETTTINASSFKGSGDVASKTRIETGYVIVVVEFTKISKTPA